MGWHTLASKCLPCSHPLRIGDDAMSRANWRSAGAYEGLRSLDAPAFALQFVSRNRDFIRERATLQRALRRGALMQPDAEAFARRWGLRFRKCPHCAESAYCLVECRGAAGRDRDDGSTDRSG
ncbi:MULTISPECIES: transcriptional regulator domain-containing protein [unclassified Gluconobacter]